MNFSLRRVWALLVKEILQMRRDRLTLGMMLGVPLMQLFLFGFAINLNPRDLPAAVAINDPGPLARSIVAGLVNSSYFKIVEQTNDPKHARRLLQERVDQLPAPPVAARSRRTFFSTLPVAFSGRASTTWTTRGTL